MLNRLRLGNRRRQLLREAAKGRCIVSAADTRSQKSARQRAAVGLVRSGLAKPVRVHDLDARGRMCDLCAIELTEAGIEVYRAWYPQIRNGGVIRWCRHEALAREASWRWAHQGI